MWKSTDFTWGEFTLPRRGPPPQTGLMTERKLRNLIDAGYGQGSFQRYKPWLRVTKRDFSTRGVMGHLPGVSFARLHHFRSIAEKRTIQAAKWLGAVDVREAFPAWPWSHPHPAGELPGYETMGDVPGLLDVARDAGIDHGTYVGTNIPYVATIDEVTTWLSPSGHYRLVALENKPESITNAPDPTLRAKERLELMRRYCKRINIRHVVINAHRENCPVSPLCRCTRTTESSRIRVFSRRVTSSHRAQKLYSPRNSQRSIPLSPLAAGC